MSELKRTILVHIKWNIVKTMDVNVKNPTKPNSAPPYIQEKTDKIVHFSWSITKTSYVCDGAQKTCWDYGEEREVTLLHNRLRGQRLQQGILQGVGQNVLKH